MAYPSYRKQDTTIRDIVYTGIAGIILGVSLGSVTCRGLQSSKAIDSAKTYRREGKPEVIKIMYNSTSTKDLLVKDAKEDKYVTLDKYLESIPNEADKKVEEAEIKKAADWYNK